MKDTLIERILIIFAICISFLATYISYTNHYLVVYNDAASHINISRRVVDSLTPGLAQIGTVWLPLPHILMLPFASNDYLWHTGFAGSVVSMAAFIISVPFMYKTILLITQSKTASIIGALLFALNPNLLYLQTTAMTEPLLIVSIVIAVYYLAKYIKTNTVLDLILCSTFVAFSTLIRYDGWFLFLCLSALLPIWISFIQNRKRAESNFILFLFAGGFGIFLWLLWNLAIFGDALYFIRGPYSAAAQQKVLESVGQLPTKGSVYMASFYYMRSIFENNGIYLAIAAGIAAVFVPFLIKQKTQLIVILAISSPILFNIIALYLGQSAMNVPHAPHDPGLFNIRYGIMALPAIALILGILASNKYLKFAVVLVLIIQSVMFVKQGIPISLADGLHGLHNTYYTVEASKWLAKNYTGGLILTSLASHDAFVARAGLPMKLYIHEGTRDYWTEALNKPSQSATYIAVLSFPPDSVYRKLYKNPDFLNNYVKVHTYEKFEIYKRR